MVETIGKPVFHRYTGDLYGSWLIDAQDAEVKIFKVLYELNH